MRQQGAATQAVQHFGQRTFHPCAFTCGHDDDINLECHEISCLFLALQNYRPVGHGSGGIPAAGLQRCKTVGIINGYAQDLSALVARN